MKLGCISGLEDIVQCWKPNYSLLKFIWHLTEKVTLVTLLIAFSFGSLSYGWFGTWDSITLAMVVKIKAWTWHFVCFLVGSDFPHSSFCPSVLRYLRLLLFWFMLIAPPWFLRMLKLILCVFMLVTSEQHNTGLYTVKLERSQCYCNLLFLTVSKCTT